MLKKAASFVLASLGTSTYGLRLTGGKVTIRSHVIEASGSSEAWYVPPRPSLAVASPDDLFEPPAGFLSCTVTGYSTAG
jgi:uncharacterized membrane protein